MNARAGAIAPRSGRSDQAGRNSPGLKLPAAAAVGAAAMEPAAAVAGTAMESAAAMKASARP